MSDTEREAFLAEIRRTGEPLAILMYADWLEEQGDELCDDLREIETRGELDDWALPQLVAEMDERSQRWLAANCAMRVLPFWESEKPADDRPRSAIHAVHECALHGEEAPKLWAVHAQIEWAVREMAGTPLSHAGHTAIHAANCDPVNASLRSAARAAQCVRAALGSGRAVVETDWQVCHAFKILHLGMIPLTDAERMEYA